MIDGSKKRNRQLAFELQNSPICEKRSTQGFFGVSIEQSEHPWQCPHIPAGYFFE